MITAQWAEWQFMQEVNKRNLGSRYYESAERQMEINELQKIIAGKKKKKKSPDTNTWENNLDQTKKSFRVQGRLPFCILTTQYNWCLLLSRGPSWSLTFGSPREKSLGYTGYKVWNLCETHLHYSEFSVVWNLLFCTYRPHQSPRMCKFTWQ